jgi:uncharacterized DUF497 family protein
MFDWDRNNLRKIRAHRIKREEAEDALLNDPIPVYEQDVEGERRFVYYGETNAGRFLAVIVTERGDRIRVVTAYDLDAGQRRDYIERRTQGEWANEQENTADAEVQDRERGGGLVGQQEGTRLCEAESR